MSRSAAAEKQTAGTATVQTSRGAAKPKGKAPTGRWLALVPLKVRVGDVDARVEPGAQIPEKVSDSDLANLQDRSLVEPELE